MRKIYSSIARWAVILIFGAGVPCLPRQQISASVRQHTPPGVQLLSCDRSGAVIELNLPSVAVNSVRRGEFDFSEISIQGWPNNIEEGQPALPQSGLFVALPPGSQAALAVEVLESHTATLDHPPLPAPTLQFDPLGKNSSEVFSPDAAIYASSALFPQEWAALGEPVWQRTYYIVPLRIYPVRYLGHRGQISMADKMRIRISFRGGRQGRFISDPHGDALAKTTLINYGQARGWQEKSGGPPPQIAQAYGQYKVLVDRDGIYRITYDDLMAAGIDPLQIAPQTLKLSIKLEQGAQDTIVQIPIWVAGQEELDGEFDQDDYILFFGGAPRGTYTYNNLYTSQNVYWLDWDGAAGLRLGIRSVSPVGSALPAVQFMASTRTELDTMYDKFGFAPETDAVDHWMWLRLDSNINPEYSALLNLPEHVAPPAGPAYSHYDLTMALRGYTYDELISPDHRAYGYWNSTSSDPIFDVTFDMQNDTVVSVQIPATSIEAFNQVILEAPDVPEVYANAFYLDRIEVDYWRSYRALNDTLLFQKPQDKAPQYILYTLTGLQSDSLELWDLTTGSRLTDFYRGSDTLKFRDFSTDTTNYYLAGQSGWMTPQIEAELPSEWKNPANGADYIMITHEDFYDALEPLMNHYIGRGMRVARAKVGDIHDEFNFGMKDPQSIFDFLQYAFFNYQDPPPAFALFVGDASWDYKNLDPLPYQDFVPTHHYWTWKWGETSSDNWQVAVSGADPLPDYFVGRLPVNNEAEIDQLVQKSLAYAEAPPGYWRSRIIFSNGAASLTIDAPVFDSWVDTTLLEDYFPDWYEPPRIYALPSVGYEQYYGTSEDLIGYWNQGAAYVNYMGHAGNQIWETLDLPQIAELDNGLELPFVGSYSCFTGIFSNTRGFGETMILEPEGGAIAYWSNCGIGYLNENKYINDELFQALYADDVPTIGGATTQAKWTYYAEHGNSADVVTNFVLLGDPGSLFAFIDPDPQDTLDNTPPVISISVGDSLTGGNFENGDFVDNPAKIYGDIYDSTGVAIYSIQLHLTQLSGEGDLLDTTYHMPQDSVAPEITLSFNPPDSSGQHVLVAFVDSLASGEWRLVVSAADSFDQGPTEDSVRFKISSGELEFVGKLLNYPNPFANQTAFTFDLTVPAEVTIKIYTVSGKLIQVLQRNAEAGYNILEWDGRDAQGDPISNGAYLYKVIARNGETQVEKIEKMARIR